MYEKKKIRRIVILICIIIIFAALVVYTKSIMLEPEITTEVAGKEVVIDTVNKTITDGEYIYEYYMDSYGDDKTMSEVHVIGITYPNGYMYKMNGSSLKIDVDSSKTLENTDEKILSQEYRENYVSGKELVALIKSIYSINDNEYIDNIKEDDKEDKNEKQDRFGIAILVFSIIVMFIGGMLLIIDPEAEWERRFGRHIANADPTDESIKRIRWSGWVLLIASIGFAIWVFIRFC